MLILMLVIAIAILVTFIVLRKRAVRNERSTVFDVFTVSDIFESVIFVSILVCAGLIIAICCLAPKVATESVIDSKIAMYQEENARIEQDFDRIVKGYLEHEHDTFSDIKPEGSTITLITLFPELKADTLVQRQLDVYVANSAKIKSLREEKINLVKNRWILYFGR